jgi:hypothetical protein
LLSVEVLFVWLPFGKLAHAFLVFFSRGVRGALARKGARSEDPASRRCPGVGTPELDNRSTRPGMAPSVATGA